MSNIGPIRPILGTYLRCHGHIASIRSMGSMRNILSKYSLFAGSILSQGNSPKRYCACRILRNVIVSIFYLFAAYRQFVILISRRARYCISFRFLSPFPVSRRSCPYPRTPLRQSCIRVLPENLLQSPGCSW